METCIKRKMTFVLLMVATDKSEKIFIKKNIKTKQKKNREIENTDLFFSQKVGSLYVVFCWNFIEKRFSLLNWS